VDNTEYQRVEDPVDGTVWNVDAAFLESRWTCIWGAGCKGILPTPAEELNQGCCSHGCQFLDQEEAMNTGALATLLEPERFQFHAEAASGGIYADEQRTLTRVVDGACIFHNRPGFDGGEGCALHLGALDAGESPTTWKPSVCWQLPLRVEDQPDGSRTLRHWGRTDWDDEQSTIAWCCTEEPEAHVGDRPVVESLHEELTAMVGPEVYVELRNRFGTDRPTNS
jgi:hypothetical protein